MNKTTAIEWTDHTLNFWWGCSKVSPACSHCYAESFAKFVSKKLFGQVVEWGLGKPRFERLEAARKEALKLNNKAGRDALRGVRDRPRVFVNSMSDWLDEEVPIEWLAYLLETLFMCPHLDFQLLTKRPENWKDRITRILSGLSDSGLYDPAKHGWLSDWRHDVKAPPNLWIGTTVESQEWADKRIPHLLKIPAKVRFLSCEPLLGPVDLEGMEYFTAKSSQGIYPFTVVAKEHRSSVLVGIKWVIVGGESGGHARPSHPDWFRSLRDQCAAAHVPFFFKQWGEYISLDNLKFSDSEDACLTTSLTTKYKGQRFADGTLMLRVGKDHPGRLLDGQEHSAFPNS